MHVREAELPYRIVLVDDHEMVRRGLAELIGGHEGFEVAAEVRTASEALEAVAAGEPDLVLADLVLGTGPDGIQLTKGIKADHPNLPVLVLSGRDEALFAERALLAGASGYVMKDEAVEVLFEAMAAAMAGRVWLSTAMTDRLLPPAVLRRSPAPSELDADPQAAGLIAEMKSGNRTVLGLSRALNLSPAAVDAGLDRLRDRFGLPSRASLYLYVQRT